MDGLQVLQELRQAKIKAPVLLLTVRAMIEDKVLGLDAGADDYLTKPFSFQELLARSGPCSAAGRSGAGSPPGGRYYPDPSRPVVRRGDRKNRVEHQGIRPPGLLMRNPGRVLTRTMISEHVWDYDFDTATNIIDVYVNLLPQKNRR